MKSKKYTPLSSTDICEAAKKLQELEEIKALLNKLLKFERQNVLLSDIDEYTAAKCVAQNYMLFLNRYKKKILNGMCKTVK